MISREKKLNENRIDDGDVLSITSVQGQNGSRFISFVLGHRASSLGLILHEGELEYLLRELKVHRQEDK